MNHFSEKIFGQRKIISYTKNSYFSSWKTSFDIWEKCLQFTSWDVFFTPISFPTWCRKIKLDYPIQIELNDSTSINFQLSELLEVEGLGSEHFLTQLFCVCDLWIWFGFNFYIPPPNFWERIDIVNFCYKIQTECSGLKMEK